MPALENLCIQYTGIEMIDAKNCGKLKFIELSILQTVICRDNVRLKF